MQVYVLIATAAFGLLLGLIVAFPFMLLWDWIMPAIFGLPEITWLQSWGLLVMANFLLHMTVKVDSKA